MDERLVEAVGRVLDAAAELVAALRRSSPKRNPGAEVVAGLVERDAARLERSLGEDGADVRLALIFPSLDARAADLAGGVDFDGDPTLALPYRRLIEARMAARAVLVEATAAKEE